MKTSLFNNIATVKLLIVNTLLPDQPVFLNRARNARLNFAGFEPLLYDPSLCSECERILLAPILYTITSTI